MDISKLNQSLYIFTVSIEEKLECWHWLKSMIKLSKLLENKKIISSWYYFY